MVNATIEGDMATLEIRVSIPKHYYDFLEFLEDVFGYEETTRMAANGIIGELNIIHEELTGAISRDGNEVNPDLSVGSKIIKAAEAQQKEERQP